MTNFQIILYSFSNYDRLKFVNFKCLLNEQFLDCFIINEYLVVFQCPLIHWASFLPEKRFVLPTKEGRVPGCDGALHPSKTFLWGSTVLWFFCTFEKLKSSFCVLPLLFSFQSTAEAIGSSSVPCFQGSKVTECLVVPVLTCVLSGELCNN